MSDLDPLVFVKLPGTGTWVRRGKVVSVSGAATSEVVVEGRADPVVVHFDPTTVLAALDDERHRWMSDRLVVVEVEVDEADPYGSEAKDQRERAEGWVDGG